MPVRFRPGVRKRNGPIPGNLKQIIITNKEKDACTYIGSASIKLENTERRDKLVKAAEKAGFKVDCSEAIDVSFSGASTQPYWSITVYWPVKLDRIEKIEAKRKLANAWESL